MRTIVITCVLLAAGGQGVWCGSRCLAAVDQSRIDDLIRQLGDDDFAVREAAADALAEIGADAADSLLAAAESSDDLEVALKARWLAESLPLAAPHDPPEVAALLDRYARADVDARVRLMHRLLRLDHDAGIEPLARIVRLERTTAGSRIAAALLAREWQPDDPAWAALAPRIRAGLGSSDRPTARFVRVLAAADTSPTRAMIDEAVAAAALLERPVDSAGRGSLGDDAGMLGDAKTTRIFRRSLVALLASAGRHDEALTVATSLFDACRSDDAGDDLLAAEMAWLADHGLPQASALLAQRVAADAQPLPPLLAYAVAVARRRGGDEVGAAALADRVAAVLSEPGVDLSRRLQAAMVLASWGAADWALREYRSIVDDPKSPLGDLALAGILGGEFLHDQTRHAEAAAMFRVVLDGRGDEDMPQILMRLERDPRSVRSRMLYFEACAAAARGDAVAHRTRLQESLAAYPKDVDSLIAWYRLCRADPAQRAEAAARVARAAEQIDEEIQAVPDDANGYNEYAWLVANTEGDVGKAQRYAKRALELSFDSPSYLDTLAHCRAAAGDAAGAYRTQLLAVRQEPHNVTIRRNLDRFRAALPQQP